MRKVIIIILALVVALSAVPITFACYNGGWGYWRPHKPIVYCPSNCKLVFTSVTTSDNEKLKDVADTTACIKDCGNKLVITITNDYPGYEGIVDFCVQNTGSMVATINGITINNPNPGYLQIDLTGEVQPGIPIQPGETKCGHLVIYGIPQLPEAENATFTFTITINYQCTYVPKTCDTAYAYGGTYAHCFLIKYLGKSFTKWGWTNGPLGSGTYTFDIYAGAAQCNLLKGKKVGTLTVNYDGSRAIVTYNITHPSYRMTETHLYVGNEPWPRTNGNYTVSPGLYPYSHSLDNATTDQYVIEGLSGNIYIIAHAEVCW